MARRRFRLILPALFGVLLVVAIDGVAARAADSSHAVAIANFDYAPQFLEVTVGDTVAWTNVDATVHTVTEEGGAFVSGSIHQGQTYSLQFNQPGVYSYFCEPHPKMRGRIVVTGTAPAPSPASVAPPTTLVPPPPVSGRGAAPAHPAASTTTSAPAGVTPSAGPSAAVVSAVAPRIVASTGAPVSAGMLSGRARRLAAPLVAVAVAALAGVGLAAASRQRHSAAAGATATAGVLTLAAAGFHLQLHFALRYPEPIGTLMILAAGAGTLVGAYLLLTPADRGATTLGLAFNAALIAAFVLSRTHTGIFGYREVGWDPAPQAAAAVAIEASALAALGAGLYASWRSR